MSEIHLAYLNLGSNIQPGAHLPKAVGLLSQFGEILQISQVWESEPVGLPGQNYLNACVLFKSIFTAVELKENVIRPIEAQLGRQRNEDKFSPRTMDIDIVLFDGISIRNDLWELAYVVVPLADIHPHFKVPLTGEMVLETATRLRRDVWLEMRRGVIS